MARIISWIVSRDQAVFRYLNQGIYSEWSYQILQKITHLGGARITILITLLATFGFGGDLRRTGIQALLSLTISHLIAQVIKRLISRERPYIKLEQVHFFLEPLLDYSFPSGHTTAIFSIMVVFSLNAPVFSVLLLSIALLVALSRIYLGYHYPSDCIVGAFLGSITAITVVALFPL